ncbi:Ankyrin repeat protein [Tolypocladium paradoxum]|uniref:Ankyrin repeat protein n=1 Tax=Tolypocladium paradoxum TaxID=94208 RepID=A0A2S4KQ02_9HYPO|nr:Ankyrin repeat protein [Tolypocladium paradoxum]
MDRRLDVQRRLRETSLDAPDTTLHACIRDNDIPKLRHELLLSGPTEINNQSSDWGAPLHIAVLCDNLAAVRLLLDAGADPLAETLADGPSSPLMVAIRHGNRGIIQRLWAHVPPENHANGRRPFWSCLAYAATFGQVPVVCNLLDWWDSWSAEVRDCALIAAAGRWHAYVVELLLTRFTYSATTLSHALQKAINFKTTTYGEVHELEYDSADYLHQQQLIALLIEAGANPNTLEHGLHLTIQATRYIELVGGLKALLENGADSDAKGDDGQSALHRLGFPIPARRRHPPSYHLHETGIRLLLQHGASVRQPDAVGNTPLHCAAFGSNVHIFQLYLSVLADQGQEAVLSEARNNHGETILHWAAAGGKVDILQCLLSRGAAVHVNNSTPNGWTPLMCALATTGPPWGTPIKRAPEAIQAAELLLLHGADPLISTAEGWTPLHCLALHLDNDPAGDAAQLAMDFILRGVDVAARAPMLVRDPAGQRPSSGHYGRPWGFRVREVMQQLAATQPDLIKHGRTALHWAAERGAVGITKALLENGADPLAVDASGMAPGRLAAESPWLGDRRDIRHELQRILHGAVAREGGVGRVGFAEH